MNIEKLTWRINARVAVSWETLRLSVLCLLSLAVCFFGYRIYKHLGLNKGSFLSLCDFRSCFQQFWMTSTNLGLVAHSLQAFHLCLNNLEKETEREGDTRKNATKVARDCNVGGVRMASIPILPMSKLSMLRASFSQPLPFLWPMLHANFCWFLQCNQNNIPDLACHIRFGNLILIILWSLRISFFRPGWPLVFLPSWWVLVLKLQWVQCGLQITRAKMVSLWRLCQPVMGWVVVPWMAEEGWLVRLVKWFQVTLVVRTCIWWSLWIFRIRNLVRQQDVWSFCRS